MSRADQPESTPAAVTVGRQLRIAREAAGVAAEDFAREANLTVRQVQAMETDEYSWFNGPVFIKGYIRVYAKRFGLNGDALIQQFEQANPEEQPKPIGGVPMRPQPLRPSHDFKFREPRRALPWLKWVAGLVLLAVLVGLGAWLQDSAWFQQQADSPSSTATAPEVLDVDQVSAVESGEVEMSLSTVVDGAPVHAGAAVALDEATDSQAEQAKLALQSAEQAAPANSESVVVAKEAAVAAAVTTTTPVNPVAPAVADETPGADAAAAVAADSAQSIDEDSQRLLRLEFSDECWVQVKDASGRVIHERIHKAGDAVDLDIVPPVQLWFGRARAVNVTYNGTAVALPLKAGSNSVKFTFTDAQGQTTLE